MSIFDLSSYSFAIYAIPAVVTLVAVLLLGVFDLLQDRITPISVAFFGLAFMVAIWLCANTFMLTSPNAEVALWWARIAYLGIPFIAPAAYVFSTTVLHVYEKQRPIIILAWVLAAFFTAMALGSDTLISGVQHYDWGYYGYFGWLGIPFIGYFIILLCGNIWLYWREYRVMPPGRHKRRVRLLMFGFAVSYLGGIDFLPAYGVDLYPFGYLAVLGFIVLGARAIWAYRFDDITPALAADEIIETMLDAVLVLDSDGIVRVANRAAGDLLGISREALAGRQLIETPGAALLGEQRALPTDGESSRYEIDYRAADGSVHILDVSASAKLDRRGRLMAVVYIATDVTERRRSEAEIRQLNESLEQRVGERTAQLAAANADLVQLAEARDRALAEAQLLNQIATTASGQEDLSAILSATLDNLSLVISFSGGSIALVEDDELVIRAAIGPFAEMALNTRLPRSGGKSWEIIRMAEPFMNGDLSRSGVRATSPVRSFLGVPLVWSGVSFGLLEVDSVEVNAFTAADLELMLKVANALSGSIQLATLYGEMGRAMRLEQVRAVQLRRLSDAANSINSLLSIDAMLQVITDRARETIGANQAVSNTTGTGEDEPPRTSISLAEKYGPFCALMAQPRLPAIYELFGNNRSLRLSAAELEAHPQRALIVGEGETRRPLRGWLAAPLLDRTGRKLGLIELSDQSQGEFSEQDEDILVQFAQMAAVAMENARLYREAEDAVRSREVLLSVVSHDLRNLLTAVGASGKLLRRFIGTPQAGERAEAALGRIDDAVVRMNALISELLDFARLQAGQRLELYHRRTDLLALARRLAAEMQQNTDRHEIVVRSDLSELQGLWDSARLERALLNLLSNAVKYSPRGGEIAVEVSKDDSGPGWAVLVVRDGGIGIPAADLPHVFDWFRRATNVANRITGTGIGLASVAQVVQEHGGSITVASEEGHGSAFTIRLPLLPPSHQPPTSNGPTLAYAAQAGNDED